MKILVVEDDNIIQDGLRISLVQEGYEVVTASSVRDAFIAAEENDFNFCLIDVMLPDGDGYSVCKKIREKSQVPIIFLTACDDEIHTVLALEQGADDYITKPFRIRELLARMKAILRRTNNLQENKSCMISVGNNQVNIQSGKIYCEGKEVFLTAMEYKLLLIFINNRGQIISRQQILNAIWDDVGNYVNDNTLTVYIKRLREKLGATEENPIVVTVRGIGYRMDAN